MIACRMTGVLAGILTAAAVSRGDELYLSPAALAAPADGSRIHVACATAKRILTVDPAAARVSATIEIEDHAVALALSPDGRALYAAGGEGAGKIWVIDPDKGAAIRSFAAGHSPADLAVSPDGATLYVCDRFLNRILVLDAATGAERASIAVPREPVACALTPKGDILVVVNHLPAGPATADVVSIEVSLIDTASGTVAANVRLPNGCTAGRDVALSPDGRFAYVTSILGRFTLPTTQLDRGWMMTSALSVIDVAGRSLVNTVLLDELDRGAPNPWGVVCAPDGARLVVAHSSTHEASVIDRVKLHDRLDRVAKGEQVTQVSSSPAQVPNDLSFLVDIRRRVRLPGNSPRAMVAAGDKVYAGVYFSDLLAVLNLAATPPATSEIRLGPELPLTLVRKGEILFNDAALCFQEWQSCTSCHPDIRTDGLNWDLLNDGMGNPKQTKSMLLSHVTSPAMMSGVRESAEVAVRAGIRHIQFVVRPEEDAVAIDEYLKTLKPVPSPHLVDGKMSEAAKRGEAVFAKAGCAECHPAPLFTSMGAYDIGTALPPDKGNAYDSPTLVEVWRTAPYLVDGRAATMRDVLTTYNKDDLHGRTSGLSEQELADLEAFVLAQ